MVKVAHFKGDVLHHLDLDVRFFHIAVALLEIYAAASTLNRFLSARKQVRDTLIPFCRLAHSMQKGNALKRLSFCTKRSIEELLPNGSLESNAIKRFYFVGYK